MASFLGPNYHYNSIQQAYNSETDKYIFFDMSLLLISKTSPKPLGGNHIDLKVTKVQVMIILTNYLKYVSVLH